MLRIPTNFRKEPCPISTYSQTDARSLLNFFKSRKQ